MKRTFSDGRNEVVLWGRAQCRSFKVEIAGLDLSKGVLQIRTDPLLGLARQKVIARVRITSGEVAVDRHAALAAWQKELYCSGAPQEANERRDVLGSFK